MQTYKDSAGIEWKIDVNAWTLRAVRENSGELLTTIAEDNASLYAKLYADPILLADIIWPLIEEQAKERDVSLRQFCESFSGDCIASARDAVVEATIDFFDDQEKRDQIRVVFAKTQILAEKLRAVAAKKIRNLDVDALSQDCVDFHFNTAEPSVAVELTKGGD